MSPFRARDVKPKCMFSKYNCFSISNIFLTSLLSRPGFKSGGMDTQASYRSSQSRPQLQVNPLLQKVTQNSWVWLFTRRWEQRRKISTSCQEVCKHLTLTSMLSNTKLPQMPDSHWTPRPSTVLLLPSELAMLVLRLLHSSARSHSRRAWARLQGRPQGSTEHCLHTAVCPHSPARRLPASTRISTPRTPHCCTAHVQHSMACRVLHWSVIKCYS